jgi:protein NrfD
MESARSTQRSSVRVAVYVLLAAATAIGLWAIGRTIIEGHIHEATTQHVPWGLWVALYIFFLGLSAGSFLISTLIYVFKVKQLEEAGPLALYQALACLILGGMLIVLDAGHPVRFYKLLIHFNPTSVMAWMGFFYNVYILIILLEIYFVLRPWFIKNIEAGKQPVWLYRLLSLGSRRLDTQSLARDAWWLMVLGILGIPAAIIVHGGVGTIFAVAKARPNWFGGLFPFVFIVSALASGGALLTLLTASFSPLSHERKVELLGSLGKLTIGVLLLDTLLLFSDLLTSNYGGIPAETRSWHLTLFGPYWWIFWVVQLGLGVLLPVLLVAFPATRRRVGWMGLAGFLVLLGVFGMRLNLVIPPQITPAFKMSIGAYHDARYALGYFPSLNEWLVGLGAFSLGGWMLVLVLRFLPISGTSPEPAPKEVA